MLHYNYEPDFVSHFSSVGDFFFLYACGQVTNLTFMQAGAASASSNCKRVVFLFFLPEWRGSI